MGVVMLGANTRNVRKECWHAVSFLMTLLACLFLGGVLKSMLSIF